MISQTSQAFLPSYGVYEDESKEWKSEADKLVFRLEKVGVGVGAFMAAVVGSIVAFFPGIVTKDLAVQGAVKPLAATLAAGAFLTAPVA